MTHSITYKILIVGGEENWHPCAGTKNTQDILITQTKDGKGQWDNCFYTTDVNAGPFDAVVKVNYLKDDIPVRINPKNIINIHMEPDDGRLHDFWMNPKKNQHCDARAIISHNTRYDYGKKHIVMQALQSWFINRTYPELVTISDSPAKDITDTVVWITSKQTLLPIQKLRMAFYDAVMQSVPEIISLHGRDTRPVDDKYALFSKAQYVMTIENHTNPHGWTEKLADAYLAYCLPIYYGPDNLDDYFPKESYIRIDINKPYEAIRIIQDAIKNNEWEKRLPAIKKARELVLNTYNFAPWMTQYINDTFVPAPYKDYTLKKSEIKESISAKIKFIYRSYRLKEYIVVKRNKKHTALYLTIKHIARKIWEKCH